MRKNLFMVFLGVFLYAPFNALEAIPLKANFSLLGEVYRFNYLAFGGIQVEVSLNDNVLAEGHVDYGVVTPPQSGGLFSSIDFPDVGQGYKIIDFDFSVPFNLDLDQEAKFDVVFYASAIRLVIDFSNSIYWQGSLLENTPGQGLFLNSVTLADGRPLSDVGLQFKFLPENTLLTTYATNGVNQPADSAMPPDIAQVSADNVAFALASVGSDPLLQLSISPEPNPLIWDFACAGLGTRIFNGCGGLIRNPNNILLTTMDNPPDTSIPEPNSFILVTIGLIAISLLYSNRGSSRILVDLADL